MNETCMIDGSPAVLVVDASTSLDGYATDRHGRRFPSFRIALCAKHADEYHDVDLAGGER